MLGHSSQGDPGMQDLESLRLANEHAVDEDSEIKKLLTGLEDCPYNAELIRGIKLGILAVNQQGCHAGPLANTLARFLVKEDEKGWVRKFFRCSYHLKID